MTKKEIRKKYVLQRSQLSKNEVDTYSLQIANNLLELSIWSFKTYHIFLPIERMNEVNTEYVLNILYGKDKDIVLPKIDMTTKTLTHLLLTEQTILKKNHWGIIEPSNGVEISPQEIDVVFVPLLVYDKNGNRVGYGGGYYDKFLSQCKENVLRVGLSFFPCEENIIDVLPTDIPLNYCVTPSEIYKF